MITVAADPYANEPEWARAARVANEEKMNTVLDKLAAFESGSRKLSVAVHEQRCEVSHELFA